MSHDAITTAAAGACLGRLLTVRELSDCLGIPVATLCGWRVDHHGPKAVKLDHALRYPAGAVRAWRVEQLDSRAGAAARHIWVAYSSLIPARYRRAFTLVRRARGWAKL